MTVALIFLACIMAVILWWLARQTINVAPWQEVSAAESLSPDASETVIHSDGLPASPVKVGLGAFLCVATSLFGLLMSAYYSRMEAVDWIQLRLPALMWFNTAVLLASCIVVHWTRHAQRAGRASQVKSGLLWGGLLTLLFLFGQLVVWQQLNLEGQTPTANVSNAFFYLFTAVHGIHLLGGLLVWFKATLHSRRRLESSKPDTSVELCTVYWDYLFVVWLVLFTALLTN